MSSDAVAAAPAVGWYNAESYLANLKRAILLCGGYGSGKTEVAVNLAVRLRETGREVSIADLDVVNLYFRTREARVQLRLLGVEVLMPSEALVNADLPVVQPEVRGAMLRSRGVLILDLGGDPAGARVLASISPRVPEAEFSGCFVLNSRRPATSTVGGASKMIDGIRVSSGANVTELVVNAHLGDETTPEVIGEGIALAEEVSAETGLGIAFVAVDRRMVGSFDPVACRYPVMVMDRLMLKPWEESARGRPNRSNWLGRRRFDG